MALQTNSAPYFDSFDESKKFHQVLFRPGYPVQARELNEIQSILQSQIDRFGRHVFKEGSVVIPGQVSADLNYAFVKIESTFSGQSVINYIQTMIDGDVILKGQSSGVTAKIIGFSEATEVDPLTIFVKYIGSGTSGQSSTFTASETILSDDVVPKGLAVMSTSNTPVGFGSAVNVQKGVYFVRGKFVMVDAQTLILDKYSRMVTKKVGLRIDESFVTPEEDSSLLDNAQGSSNYAAPGAHRHFIDLKLSVDDGTSNFIELINIDSGVVTKIIDIPAYSVLEETLARRTYDESGNYTVTPFNIQVKEHRSNDRGGWLPNTKYQAGDIFSVADRLYVVESAGTSGTVAPTHTSGSVLNGTVASLYEPNPVYNNGAFSAEAGGDSSKIAIGIDAGKAYVLGHEIINQSTKFISVDKAQTSDSIRVGTIPMSLGSYVKVDSAYGALNVVGYPTIKLYDRYITANGTASGTQVGTATARYMEFDTGTIGSATYLMSLVDISMNSGKKFEADVRSFYFDNATGADFTANAQKNISRLLGSVSVATASPTVNGVGTAFTSELNPGDAIVVYNGSTPVILTVSTISSDTLLTLTGNAGVTLTNTSIYISRTVLFESSDPSLLMHMPHSFIKSLRSVDNPSISNASYYVRQKFSGTVAGGQTVINTALSTETFGSPQQPDTFIVVNETTGEYINATITLNPQANSATIVVGAGHNGSVVTVIASVRKVAKERTKTIVRYFTQDFINQSDVAKTVLQLSKTDGIKLRKVSFFTSAGTPIPFGSAIPSSGVVEVDITKSYQFGNGQTDAYYGPSTISRNVGASIPASPIRVVFDYYEHSTGGDYFSVDSYTGVPPTFKCADGEIHYMRDTIDFRPDRPTTGFVPVGVPSIGFDFVSDYSYYLPRIDSLYLMGDGSFVVSQGVPALSPVTPATPSSAMNLATISVQAKSETIDSTSVVVSKTDNRRYTMQDIGKIDRRLQNVEYYTSLSLLEQQTSNMQLFDSAGNLNFKNGFIVDPFSGQNIGDVTSPEYRCSIDPTTGIMRPGFSVDNINLVESANSQSERLSMHYVNNDGIITLPYEDVVEISQPFASRTESITPFIQFNFVGDVSLTPSSDEWYETAYAPSIVINREGNYAAVEQAYQSQLGTVWNAWQTNWSGTSTSRVLSGSIGWVESNLVTSQVDNQTRTGTKTFVQAVYSDQVIDDVVIRVDMIPYIRSRSVLFVGQGLKSSTKVYPFFDSVAVDSHVTPATTINLTSKSGQFDFTTSAGSDVNQSARLILGNVSISLGTGDVIHNGAGNNLALATATAVVVLDEDTSVKVLNVKGTFTAGQTVYGSISGVSAVISSVVSNTSLVTNEYGEVAGLFNIPSNSQVKFLTGQRTFRLTSSVANDSSYLTRADGVYTATGYLQTHQQTIISTRNGVVQSTQVSDARTVSTVINSVFAGLVRVGGDPLAQSFTVEPSNGMFVTGVDVFFSGKDRSVPMWFNIVEVSNGIPTKKVVSGSHTIIKPNQIITSQNGSIATRIKTKHPIYLRGGVEYAFVMGSDSTQYTVWVSHLGENDIQSGKLIVRQPYLGSMFKSQNASTWTPAQLEDVKFNLIRAKFDVSAAANAKFIASDLPTVALRQDPFFIRSGSNKVRVFLNNHGLLAGSKVTISGAVAFDGIPAGDLNIQHTVVSTEFDSFVIQIATTSTSNGFGGGSLAKATKNVRFDLTNIFATQLQFDNTSIKHFVAPTSLDYVKAIESIEVSANSNTRMNAPKIVSSKENSVASMSGDSSLDTFVQMTSTSDYLSPVLDIDRYSMVAIGNRINTPTTTITVAGLDSYSIGTSTAIAFAADRITTVSANSILSQAKVGRYLTISGAAAPANNGSFLISEVASDGSYVKFSGVTLTVAAAGASIVMTLNDRFVDEMSPTGGSSEAKYIIKAMTLNLPADQLSVFLDVNRPAGSSVDLYYRLGIAGSNIAGANWSKLSSVDPITTSDNQSSFAGVVYKLNSAAMFDVAQVKIVLTSTDTTKVPLVKNLRMIAMS